MPSLTDLIGQHLAHLDVREQHNLDGTASGAVRSGCRAYRYVLTRTWEHTAAPLVFVMLNPSTADALTDDPTIRRCAGFARREHAGGIVVVNAYALRATHPSALARHPDPSGPDNDLVLYQVVRSAAAPVVLAWGADATLRRSGRDREVTGLIRAAGVTPLCLGVTKGGHPRHPLYLPGNTDLISYPPDGGHG